MAEPHNTPLHSKAERMALYKVPPCDRCNGDAQHLSCTGSTLRGALRVWVARVLKNAELGDITWLCLARRGNASGTLVRVHIRRLI